MTVPSTTAIGTIITARARLARSLLAAMLVAATHCGGRTPPQPCRSDAPAIVELGAQLAAAGPAERAALLHRRGQMLYAQGEDGRRGRLRRRARAGARSCRGLSGSGRPACRSGPLRAGARRPRSRDRAPAGSVPRPTSVAAASTTSSAPIRAPSRTSPGRSSSIRGAAPPGWAAPTRSATAARPRGRSPTTTPRSGWRRTMARSGSSARSPSIGCGGSTPSRPTGPGRSPRSGPVLALRHRLPAPVPVRGDPLRSPDRAPARARQRQGLLQPRRGLALPAPGLRPRSTTIAAPSSCARATPTPSSAAASRSWRLGAAEGALETLSRVLQRDANRVEAWFYRGLANRAAGKPDAARADLTRALRPLHPPTRSSGSPWNSILAR